MLWTELHPPPQSHRWKPSPWDCVAAKIFKEVIRLIEVIRVNSRSDELVCASQEESSHLKGTLPEV